MFARSVRPCAHALDQFGEQAASPNGLNTKQAPYSGVVHLSLPFQDGFQVIKTVRRLPSGICHSNNVV
jgi:hypothetical protein